MHPRLRRLPPILLLILLTQFGANLSVLGQHNIGQIKGAIRDPQGAVIVGAEVSAENVATTAVSQTISNGAGAYVFPNLEVGVYKVIAKYIGFKTIEQSNVRVISGGTVTLDLTLALGETSQVVTVSAEAAVLDVTSTTAGTTQVNEEIRDLPLAVSGGARNSLGFMRTLPGVVWTPLAGGYADIITTESAVVGGVGGANAASGNNSYNIDGLSASGNMYQPLRDDSGPIPESIEEFRIVQNLNADSGSNLGSSVELVMKSGTNVLHGRVFEYFRNTALDARNFFAATRDVNKQNEFGASAGGPILKNRLFFFATYDGFRYRQASAGTVASVPTAAMRAGDFSSFLGSQLGTDALGRPVFRGEIFDPLTTRPDGKGGFVRDPFPGNIIPSNRFSKFAQIFQKGYPLPTQPGNANNWVGLPSPSPTDQDKITLKFDGNVGAHRLSFGHDHILRKQQNYGAVFAEEVSAIYSVDATEYRYRFSDTWTIRPNLLFDFRIGISKFPRNIGNIGFKSGSYGKEVGFPGQLTTDTPSQNIQGVGGLGFIFRTIHDPGSTTPADVNLTWVKGSHNFKTGVQAVQWTQLRANEFGGNGSFTFQDTTSGQPNFPLSGVGYASYLLGDVYSGSLQTPEANRRSQRIYGLYFMDQWRATSRLTVNYGLRWDYTSPWVETYDRIGVFSPTVRNPLAGNLPGGLTFWGDGTGRNGRRHLLDSYHKAFGPRLGLAYSVDSKTVVRASYGISYNNLGADYISLTTPLAYGWTAQASRTSLDGFTPVFKFDDGFPAVIPPLPLLDPSYLNNSAVNYINPAQGKPAMSQRLGFTIERQVWSNWLVSGEYMGNLVHGSGESDTINAMPLSAYKYGTLLQQPINSPAAIAAGFTPPYPGFVGTVGQAIRPYPQYTNVTYLNASTRFIDYQAMILKLQKRFGNGLSFLMAYTVSKQLQSIPGPHPEYPREKSLIVSDQPQALVVSYTYELPFGPGKKFLNNSSAINKYLAGGWQLMGSHNYWAGQPIQLAGRYNYVPGQPLGTGVDRHNYDPHDPKYNSQLNINAFQAPAPFTFGNTSVLPNFRQFGYLNENLSIDKSIPISERLRFRLSAQFFNVFNRVNFMTGNGVLNSGNTFGTNLSVPSNFGVYSQVGPPRNILFRALVEF